MKRGAPAAWWIKCDPTSAAHEHWDWPDLFREYRPGRPYLWSVGTPLSQRNARSAEAGDFVFAYSAGERYRILRALAHVEGGGILVPGTPPPSRSSPLPGGFTVALRPVALLENPVPLADIRRVMARHAPEFLRTRFGSIFKVSPAERRALVREVRRANPGLRLAPAWNR